MLSSRWYVFRKSWVHVDLASSILKLQPLTSCSSFTLHGLLSSKLCVDVPSPGGHPFVSFGIVCNHGKDSMQVNAACHKPFNFSSSCVLFKILDLPPAVLGVGSCKDAGTYILWITLAGCGLAAGSITFGCCLSKSFNSKPLLYSLQLEIHSKYHDNWKHILS